MCLWKVCLCTVCPIKCSEMSPTGLRSYPVKLHKSTSSFRLTRTEFSFTDEEGHSWPGFTATCRLLSLACRFHSPEGWTTNSCVYICIYIEVVHWWCKINTCSYTEPGLPPPPPQWDELNLLVELTQFNMGPLKGNRAQNRTFSPHAPVSCELNWDLMLHYSALVENDSFFLTFILGWEIKIFTVHQRGFQFVCKSKDLIVWSWNN